MVYNDSPTNQELSDLIKSVRNLIEDEKNLCCSKSDEFLIRFIKASNYDIKESAFLVKNYFKSKKDSPEAFTFKLPSYYVSTLSRSELGYVVPANDFRGRRILFLKLGNIDPYKESWSHLMQCATITLESLSLDPEIQDSGANLIVDCTNFSLKLMKWATPYKLRVIMKFFQDCIPLRFEVIHVTNMPFIFNVFLAALKPFMKDDFMEKVCWHKYPFKTLHSHMDPAFLPPHLEGTLSPEATEDWHNLVSDKEDFYKELMKMGYTS